MTGEFDTSVICIRSVEYFFIFDDICVSIAVLHKLILKNKSVNQKSEIKYKYNFKITIVQKLSEAQS